jgi:hypothetical protein
MPARGSRQCRELSFSSPCAGSLASRWPPIARSPCGTGEGIEGGKGLWALGLSDSLEAGFVHPKTVGGHRIMMSGRH